MLGQQVAGGSSRVWQQVATHRPAVVLLHKPVQLLRLAWLDRQRLRGAAVWAAFAPGASCMRGGERRRGRRRWGRRAEAGHPSRPSSRPRRCVLRLLTGGAPPTHFRASAHPRLGAPVTHSSSKRTHTFQARPTCSSGSSAASSSRSGRLVRCSLEMADSSGSVLPCRGGQQRTGGAGEGGGRRVRHMRRGGRRGGELHATRRAGGHAADRPDC